MATQIVDPAATAAIPRMEGVVDMAKLWALNGTYHISPDTTAQQLANDAGCLLESAHATLLAVIDSLEDSTSQLATDRGQTARMLYGVNYSLEMIKAMVATAGSRARG